MYYRIKTYIEVREEIAEQGKANHQGVDLRGCFWALQRGFARAETSYDGQAWRLVGEYRRVGREVIMRQNGWSEMLDRAGDVAMAKEAIDRNELGPAYMQAEGLAACARSLALLLEVYSRRQPLEIPGQGTEYLRANLTDARHILAELDCTLGELETELTAHIKVS